MDKPTTSVEWASDGAALKIQPTAKQKTHGWTTSDDTIYGTPNQPIVQYQNGWNYSASLWAAWLDENFEDISALSFEDLWQWDTADITGTGQFVDPYNTSIGNFGDDQLTWTRDDFGVPGATVLNYAPESCFGGKMLEFYDLIGRGLAIKIVDGGGDPWIIYNPLNRGIEDTQHIEPVASIAGNLSIGGELKFRINSNSSNIAILNGNQLRDDFTNFVPLTSGNFAANNPNGITVGRLYLNGPPVINNISNGIVEHSRPTRRWIRPLNISNATVMTNDTNPTIEFVMGIVAGRTYKLDSDVLVISEPITAATQQFAKYGTINSLNIESLWTTTNAGGAGDQMSKITSNFLVPYAFDVNTDGPGILIEGLYALDPRGRSGDISGIYGYGNHQGCMLLLSEND